MSKYCHREKIKISSTGRDIELLVFRPKKNAAKLSANLKSIIFMPAKNILPNRLNKRYKLYMSALLHKYNRNNIKRKKQGFLPCFFVFMRDIINSYLKPKEVYCL